MAENRNEYKNRQMRERRGNVRDIGDIPAVVNKKRRSKCAKNLKYFLTTYLSASFPSPFGPCHLKAIKILQDSLMDGGLFSLALPRGYGKTTICEGALIWATLNGYRKYCLLIAANKEKADASLLSIRKEIESNELLAEDYPEVCYPVSKLEGIALRAGGQLCNGELTHIKWGTKLVFPTVPNSEICGTIIEAVGLKGSLRGRKHKLADGSSERPDFVILDDPQDREDAESQSETSKRERIIQADVLGLSGHKRKIACVCLTTVIQKDDLADRLLSHKLHPEWRGEKTAMIISYPKAKETLWKQYFEMRKEGLADGDGGHKAHAFYKANKKAMDEGFIVSWPARHNRGETAQESAMNLLCDLGEEAFASEYQNEPIETVTNMSKIDEEIVLLRIGPHVRYHVPDDTAFLVGGIDINLYGLTWCVAAFRNDWTATLVDYGLTSDGGKGREEMTDAHYVNSMLNATLNEIDIRPYASKINGMLIDRGYMPDAVKSFIKASVRRYSVAASLGRDTTKYQPSKDARRAGNGWYEKPMDGVNTVVHNTDLHRIQAQRAFLRENGAIGGLTLWSDSTRAHREFAKQICNEFLCGVDDKGKHNWREKPGSRHDALDALVMCYVGASVMGCGSVQKVRSSKKRKAIKATYTEV